ncbi:MAG: alanyl-tRNA editing protein [Alphaproteobacteria bacterium]|nr:alanyl-tRNA editing protein [Alphaproteobacteria bacterium]
MTEELFRQDSYLKDCAATVTALTEDGAIILDRTVFYPTGGGQPGDTGTLTKADGTEIVIADTRKGETGILHIPAEGAAAVAAGDTVTAAIDWDRRYRLMRMHTSLHLLCACIEGDVTGGQIGAEKSRLDFNLPELPMTKEELADKINALVQSGHDLSMEWITDAEMDANPDLVRTMSVKPPRTGGKVRLIRIDGVDLQPCGGTHVKNTSEIGPLEIGKIENKGKQNRRINIRLAG